MATNSWHLAPGWTGPPPRLDEWRAAGLLRVVKQAPHRGVWQVALPGLDVHVKSYRDGVVSRWLRGCRAFREFRLTCEVARRGVPTLEALAWGQDGPVSYLVTRSLPEAVSLAELWQSGPAPALRQELARALGRFLAAAHRAGVCHRDLHPGNVLVRLDGGVQLFLIDLDAVRLGPPLSWPRCRDNLVVLDRWFALRASATDRFRIWRGYSRTVCLVDEGEGSRDLARRTRASMLRFTERLDRRCLGGNRHFRRLHGPGVAGYGVSDVDVAELLADSDRPFAASAARQLKRSVSSAVVEVELGGRAVVCKRHEVARWSAPLAALFRPPPALHSYLMGHALRLRGLPTPRPLAVWHRRRLGLPTQGYLLQEVVPDATELTVFVDGLARVPGDEGRRRLLALVEQLARLVRSLHGWGLSHRDLKAANVLVSPQAWVVGPRGLCETQPDGADHVWFVDLVGVRKYRNLGRSRKVQNLARLNASFLDRPHLTRTARLRFLLRYLGNDAVGNALRGVPDRNGTPRRAFPTEDRKEWKTWWKLVESATWAKAERNRRRGRPLA